jgi:hypothetical protein
METICGIEIKKANWSKNQCGQNLPTLPLTEKYMMWITTILM